MNESHRGRFAPTVLVVDDDKIVTKRWRREFHNLTSLGVVVANTLSEAASIIESKTIQIDAIVSDLIFDYGTDDAIRHLPTGVEFLAWANGAGHHVPMFVMSSTDNMVDFRRRLEEKHVPVEAFFDKFVAGQGEDPAWNQIQRSILGRKFKESVSSSEEAVYAGAVSDAMSKLQLTVRTYVQDIPMQGERILRVIKPIEAICVAKDGGIRAFAPALGLLSGGKGDTVDEALEDLAYAIGAEAETLLSEEEGDVSEYVGRIANGLREYLSVSRRGE